MLTIASMLLLLLSAAPTRLVSAVGRRYIRSSSAFISHPAAYAGNGRNFASTRSSRRNLHVHAFSLQNENSGTADPSQPILAPEQYREKIVLWRGEGSAGYSLQFRHLELANSIAASAATNEKMGSMPELNFDDMLEWEDFDGERPISDREVGLFGGAMQFVTAADGKPISADAIVDATKRCSLVRECYEVIAKADTYEQLAAIALKNGALNDYYDSATWRVRLRQYGSTSTNDKGRRYGKNVRSPIRAEKQAIQTMAELFLCFKGKVKLKDPECSLYLFKGTRGGEIVFARQLMRGPKISAIAPKTRICITNTPLESIASYNLCNFARVQNDRNVLDVYAGSCATLLAAASIAPECNTVGIEIALKKFVRKEDIVKDFTCRGLKVPAAIIRGDSMQKEIRDEARKAIGGGPFDCVVTDPPYGIREKAGDNSEPPLVQLFKVIAADRESGTPLLKAGGRLSAFVPLAANDPCLEDSLPDEALLERAGMKLTGMIRQPLNDQLARWLVAYTCIA